jgi:hypothetical protein
MTLIVWFIEQTYKSNLTLKWAKMVYMERQATENVHNLNTRYKTYIESSV